MSEYFNIFFALLIAGAAMPFIWQLIKKYVLKWAGKLAGLASLILDALLALIVLLIYDQFTIWNWIGASIIVFVVSRTVYDHIIVRFWPNRGSV